MYKNIMSQYIGLYLEEKHKIDIKHFFRASVDQNGERLQANIMAECILLIQDDLQ